MATLLHLARWLAWQIRDAELSQPGASARITVFSSSVRSPRGSAA